MPVDIGGVSFIFGCALLYHKNIFGANWGMRQMVSDRSRGCDGGGSMGSEVWIGRGADWGRRGAEARWVYGEGMVSGLRGKVAYRC